jgi:catechol 2,3-dioxygenase-like lactoylglutathione lyase family enzyme
MPATLAIAPAIRFHVSLNVSNLERSVAFYRVLFGLEPAKRRSDYAKFELADPPVVLSLEPTARTGVGALNHAGFRMPDAASLVAMQERLERAGIHSQREEGVECCYARQTKFWVYDPDQTLWEIYTLDEDIDHRGAGQKLDKMPQHSTESNGTLAAATMWEHRMNVPVPERAPFADASVDEVLLRGSLNLTLSAELRDRLLAEARRVLRPGGRLFVHVLTGERAFPGAPQLPGPAAAIQHVPQDNDIIDLIEKTGFSRVRMLKFDAKPCFVRDGVAMRETQIEAWKPAPLGERTATVIYKGPFLEMKDDAGNIFRRGQRVMADAATADRLAAQAPADAFLILR